MFLYEVLVWHMRYTSEKKNGLTTIISEGSRTIHSHPRRRLPADRFPKLQEKKMKLEKDLEVLQVVKQLFLKYWHIFGSFEPYLSLQVAPV